MIIVNKLSPRERTCLLWAARGKTGAETSIITGISYGTVKSNLDHARYKLNAVNLAQTIAIAMAHGILTPDDLAGRD